MAGRLPITTTATTTATAGGCLRHHPRLRTGGHRRLRPRLRRHPRQDAAIAGREEKCVSTPTAHRCRRFHRLALARLLAEVAEWRMSAEFAKNYIWNVSVNAFETPLVQKPSPTLMFTSLA